MSVINKLEDAYLGILRLIIIVVASLLLIGSVVMGGMALSGATQSAAPETVDTAVQPDEVIASASAKKETSSNAAASKKQPPAKVGVETDPNQAHYERAATAVINFVEQHAKGYEHVERAEAIELFRKHAEGYEDPAVTAAFAAGLADSFEKALSAPPILARVAKPAASEAPTVSASVDEEEPPYMPRALPFKESPIQVINEVFGHYQRLFAEKQRAKQAAESAAQAEAERRKGEAMTQLYAAGIAFGAFLFLVFISIVVKIERNLRGLKSVGQ